MKKSSALKRVLSYAKKYPLSLVGSLLFAFLGVACSLLVPVFIGDGIDYIVFCSNNGYSGDLNFVKIDDDFKKDVLNEKVDDVTGIQYEDADADPVPFALMGEFKGDKEGIRWIFYNCTANRPNVKGENKDNQKEPDTESLNVKASPLPVTIANDEVNIVRGGITPTMNAATYNAWFNQVIIPGTAVQAQHTPAEPSEP